MASQFSAQVGEHTIQLSLSTTNGRGLCGFLSGGLAHVGGVAYAVPRPKSNAQGLTADVSSICGPGHKDVYAAQKLAERLAIKTNETVCICAGIHIDHASPEEIARMLDCCLALADQAAESYLAEKEA